MGNAAGLLWSLESHLQIQCANLLPPQIAICSSQTYHCEVSRSQCANPLLGVLL